MGTRSYIAVQIAPTLYRAVYCHWDGYITYTGKVLVNAYNSRFRAENLLSYGSASFIHEDIGEKLEDTNKSDIAQCVFHHRDMDRDYEAPELYRSLSALTKAADSCGAEYIYIYGLDNAWTYASRGAQFFGMGDGSDFSEFRPLAADVAAELVREEQLRKSKNIA